MSKTHLPPLWIEDWRDTRAALHAYARIAGAIRTQLAPPEKHWYHVSLRTCAVGLVTPPIPGADGTFDILIDLPSSEWIVSTSTGQQWRTPLVGQSAERLCAETLNMLSLSDLDLELDAEGFGTTGWADYDREAAARYWRALLWFDVVLRHFKAGLREETSPVQVWPHHFDLAVLWLSGRRVPGQDPADPDRADEQMNFGFVPGDDEIREPYVYATAYPQPAGLEDIELPDGARWHGGNWQGALLPYDYLQHSPEPSPALLDFLRRFWSAGAITMRQRLDD
jgi:Family of unknown function (DUF5996)